MSSGCGRLSISPALFIRGNRIIALIYLTYFLIYAITPLSWTYSREAVKDSENSYSKTVRLFIVEIIESTLLRHSEANKDGSTVKIILLKKRALVSEKEELKQAQNHQEHILLPAEALLIQRQVSISSVLADKSQVWQCACPLNADLSPPAV